MENNKKLIEKFENCAIVNAVGMIDTESCVKIANEHAIGFSNLLICQDITSRGKGIFIDAYGKTVTTKDLLEIYNSTNHSE